jgi:hypothetical protein
MVRMAGAAIWRMLRIRAGLAGVSSQATA